MTPMRRYGWGIVDELSFMKLEPDRDGAVDTHIFYDRWWWEGPSTAV